jgi:hypothetical protein
MFFVLFGGNVKRFGHQPSSGVGIELFTHLLP